MLKRKYYAEMLSRNIMQIFNEIFLSTCFKKYLKCRANAKSFVCAVCASEFVVTTNTAEQRHEQSGTILLRTIQNLSEPFCISLTLFIVLPLLVHLQNTDTLSQCERIHHRHGN